MPNPITAFRWQKRENSGIVKRSGVTLIEMLVAIALVAILIGLISTGLQGAREAAAKTSCTNNLRQIGAAYHQFVDSRGGNTSKFLGNDTWVKQLKPWVENNADIFECPRGTGEPLSTPSGHLLIKPSPGITSGILYFPEFKVSLTPVKTSLSYQSMLANTYTPVEAKAWWDTAILGSGYIIEVDSLPSSIYELSAPKSPGTRFFALFLKLPIGEWGFYSAFQIDPLATGAFKLTRLVNKHGFKYGLTADLCNTSGDVLVSAICDDTTIETTASYIFPAQPPCSYGVNAKASWFAANGDSQKILAVEYQRLVADVVGGSAKEVVDWPKLAGARHQGMLNTVFKDGHVATFYPTEIDPMRRQSQIDFWLPSPLVR